MSDLRPTRRSLIAATGALALAPTAVRALQHGAIADDGWRLWVDEQAAWQDDTLFLPQDVNLATLPVNAPSGGWERLSASAGRAVTLPATVEQFDWGKRGTRPYTMAEYAWADRDGVPQNGAWRGVSWWWRDIAIPAAFAGRRILLTVRGARLRAEVYLNRKLVGYSILEELPFTCDLTEAAMPGAANQLAIRITNPGGRYDWIDSDALAWGKMKIFSSHGFGGLDRGLTLASHPLDGHIEGAWVLNRPEPKTASAFVQLTGAADAKGLSLHLENIDGARVPAAIHAEGRPNGAYRFSVHCPKARVWTLERPQLYRLVARWRGKGGVESRSDVVFGFRWFAPDGVGKDALFRLNGKRIRLTSAISWGYWALNGLWPTPDLAEKEVRQAKALGLNCLNFHRNIGKTDVMAAQDRLGLLRTMEPGGGKYALGRWPDGVKSDANSIVMQPAVTPADKFAQAFMMAKCVAMVRAFRSHPSLIQYTLQNEIGADFANPATVGILDAMRAEDESRIIALNDGLIDPPTHAAQAWYEPYKDHLHRSDREPFGAWWDMHQGAGDQWYDRFYEGPGAFTYDQPMRQAIVHFGEMEGVAVPDNHVLALAEIARAGGNAYDLKDHQEMLAAYAAFLDRWKFRGAFAKTEDLFLSIGRKSYESWRQYLENARINDACDFAVISGWESTAIDNHSGIVDNFRNFKSDPAPIRRALTPVLTLAKQHRLVVAKGDAAAFDLWLLNDTGRPVEGPLVFAMTDPAGMRSQIGSFAAPALARDQFSALVKAAVTSPALTREGLYRFSFAHDATPPDSREILVVDASRAPARGASLRVGVVGILPQVRNALMAIPGITVLDQNQACDVIVAGGLTEKSTPAQRLGGDAGIQMQRDTGSALVPGAMPASVIAAVKAGTPLLVMAQEDGLADGLAQQLSGEGAFTYRGQVGRSRAPWMGSWYFARAHPAYDGLLPDQAMGIFHQASGRQANGLMVDGDIDVFAGYGRDHDRNIGAGTFTARLGQGRLLFQRVPDLNGPMQTRFLRNALAWLVNKD